MTGAASVLLELTAGRVRWDLLRPFPRQDAAERAVGDRAVTGIARLLRQHAAQDRLEETGELPAQLLDRLREEGWLRLPVDPCWAGHGLSAYNTFRVVQAAASHSPALGLVLALSNGLGSAAYLPFLPPGPLRDLIGERTRSGLISGGADTEPSGAANRLRDTTAVPVDGGTAYLLNGEKVFVGNGPIAGLLDVSATVRAAGRDQVRLFFLDPRSPGCTVAARHTYLGLRGAPSGRLVLRDVRVPREHMLATDEDEWRLSPEISALAATARIHIIGAPALATAKLCVRWMCDFVRRRAVDGRPLGRYDQVRRIVAEAVADAFAVDTVVVWALLAGPPADPRWERVAAKNITSLTAWRTVDRTLSLLGAEGYETAASKAARGVPALPVERFFRDVRGLRVAGGVDQQVDYWLAEELLAADRPSASPGWNPSTGRPTGNAGHGHYVEEGAARLAAFIMGSPDRHPDVVLTLIGGIARELFTMAAVLARAADRPDVADLADVHCVAARHRVADAWQRIASAGAGAHDEVAERWLSGCGDDLIETDLIGVDGARTGEHLAPYR
jgi:alkylation response protein AidB-like acyl-CoA dehydrogenase